MNGKASQSICLMNCLFFQSKSCLFLKFARTMAGRFVLHTDTDVENFLNVGENKNTKRKTEGDLTLVLAFLATEKEYRKL